MASRSARLNRGPLDGGTRFKVGVMPRWSTPPLAVRIALLGPPLVGKTEIIKKVASEFGVVAETLVGMHGITRVTAAVTDTFAVAAVTGARHCPSELPSLLAWSNRLLFVLDPQRQRESENRSWLKEYQSMLQEIGKQAVQVTKADLAAANPAMCFPLHEMAAMFGLPALPTFISSTSQPTSLTRGVNHLLAAAV